MINHETITFNGWPNCIRFYNEEIDLVVSTDIGPRILRYGFIGDQNFLYLHPEQAGKRGGNEWRIYGGHRLWLAPESMPGSYYPDNDPVTFELKHDTILLTQATESTTGIAKSIEIIFPENGTLIRIVHRLTNHSDIALDLSPWAITVFRTGGVAILPQEPFGEEDDFLLPARPLVLWQYAQMNDPRWSWGDEYIFASPDRTVAKAQKIGILNRQGWSAYALNDQVFCKRFPFIDGAVYPDYNSNNELYFNDQLLEIESLAPAVPLAPGKTVDHVEHWSLSKQRLDPDASEINKEIKKMISLLP